MERERTFKFDLKKKKRAYAYRSNTSQQKKDRATNRFPYIYEWKKVTSLIKIIFT
jgi:hypothetical protein